MDLAAVIAMFVQAGCNRLFAKPLAGNDNSKNQVYFGPGFEALNLFPVQSIQADSSPGNPIFKAKLSFAWLLESGGAAVAPGAQLILYPQYPEVRFSGFLKGCDGAPSDVMRGRKRGRVLFLGVSRTKCVFGFAADEGTAAAAEFLLTAGILESGVFHRVPLPHVRAVADARDLLIAELHRISRLGWIDSKQLDSSMKTKPCTAPQCGGFTLEAELGIPKNSSAEPDFLGWEVKQHGVSNLDRIEAGTITLMTPEPTGGFYRERGVEAFVRKYGYADKCGREDRMNFGGIHKVGERHETTGLTMRLVGYDEARGRIVDSSGCVALVGDDGNIAAAWAFSGLLEHWARKHAKAAYVPSISRDEPARQYRYGCKVRLAERTDSLRFLSAFANKSVYYDPGIKVENASGVPKVKRRSQFRIASKSISALYEETNTVEV